MINGTEIENVLERREQKAISDVIFKQIQLDLITFPVDTYRVASARNCYMRAASEETMKMISSLRPCSI